MAPAAPKHGANQPPGGARDRHPGTRLCPPHLEIQACLCTCTLGGPHRRSVYIHGPGSSCERLVQGRPYRFDYSRTHMITTRLVATAWTAGASSAPLSTRSIIFIPAIMPVVAASSPARRASGVYQRTDGSIREGWIGHKEPAPRMNTMKGYTGLTRLRGRPGREGRRGPWGRCSRMETGP